jgi:hypothetical protein
MDNSKKIEEAKKLLIEATRLLTDVVEGVEEGDNVKGIKKWMENRLELWARLYNEGGAVENNRLHEIWKKMGKDSRGIGGFFVGRDASLQYTHDNKVVLTKSAADSVLAWTGMSIEEYAKKFKRE